MKEFIKSLARRTGTYESLVEIKDTILSLRFLSRNLRFRFHGAPDGLPIPPLQLIGLVAGTREINWFLEGGRLSAETITGVLKKNGVDISDCESILDFGCGSGRTIRNFATISRKTKIFGTDYNPILLEWCQKNLGFAHFQKNEVAPPLPFHSESIDFVYALSVFTHMPGDLQVAWIEEIKRILRPDGLLLFTTHGDRYKSMLSSNEREAFSAGKLVVRELGRAGSNPYCAYHPPIYVKTVLCPRFTLLDFVPEGAKGNPYQDLFLFRKT